MIQLDRSIQYRSVRHDDNFGYIVMTLGVIGRQPSKEPFPGTLHEIEQAAEKWIEEKLFPSLRDWMGPHLLSPRPNKHPVFKGKATNPLKFEQKYSRLEQIFTCQLVFECVPAAAVSNEYVEDAQTHMSDLMAPAKKLDAVIA